MRALAGDGTEWPASRMSAGSDPGVVNVSSRLSADVPIREEVVVTPVATVAFCLIAALFIGARLWQLTTYQMWFDETFSVRVARQDWPGLFTLVINDIVHPPLFYILLKFWLRAGGESLSWLRLFPLLTSMALIPLFVLLCRELRLTAFQTNLSLLLAAVNGYLIYYAQELRMYSLTFVLTMCSLWLFVRYYHDAGKGRREVAWLTAINVLLVYTHYFGWLVVGLEGVYLLGWARGKVWWFVVSVAAVVVCFSPWAYAVSQAAAGKGLEPNLGWIERPTFSDVAEYYGYLNGPLRFRFSTVLRLALFGGPVAVWCWRALRNPDAAERSQASTLWCLMLFALGPVAMSFAGSYVMAQAIWHPRYLIIVAGPYMILVAAAAGRLRSRWIRNALVLLMVTWAMWGGFTSESGVQRKSAHETEATSATGL